MSLEFVGEIIKHKIFGIGKITELNNNCIKIKFDDIEEEKDFVYPDALDSYLELNNKVLAKQVEDKLIDFRKKNAERRLKEEELKKEALELEMLKNMKYKVRKVVIKKTDSNIAFKCNYCDGGSNNGSIGYKAVCSDETIDYNINSAKNKWCSDPESNCYQYLQGNMSREELDLKINENKYVCYESKMLNEWRAYAAANSNGENKEKSKKLRNVNPGSLVLLTTILPKEKEKGRLIFAVYLLQENYEIKYEKEGFLGASDKYRIELSVEESKKLKFWDYYFNANNPEKISNSNGLYRYFNDIQAAQVLKTISEIKKGTSDEVLSTELLEHYCKIKDIDVNAIPELSGALQVISENIQ